MDNSYFIGLGMDANFEGQEATLDFIAHGVDEEQVYSETRSSTTGPIFVFQIFQPTADLEQQFKNFIAENGIPEEEHPFAVQAFRMGLAGLVEAWGVENGNCCEDGTCSCCGDEEAGTDTELENN